MHKYQASHNNNREMPPLWLPTWLWACDIFCLRQGQLPFWNIWWITMTDDYRNKHSWHQICFHPESPDWLQKSQESSFSVFFFLLSKYPYLPRWYHEQRLMVPSQRGSKSLSRTFSFTVPGWWNDLHTPIRNAGSLSIFKQQLKTHLFQLYLTSS